MTPSTTYLTLNLQYPNIATVAYAVQGDEGAREISAQLVDGSVAWSPPAGALATVRYRKPDGTTGFYDTMEDNSTPAVEVTGSTATIRIARQALTVPGGVVMQLNFYDADAQRVTTFSWIMIVQPSVLTDTQFVSTDYYNILSQQIAAVLNAAAAISGITATASGLPTGSNPKVDVTGGSDGDPYNLAFGIPAGPVFTPSVSAAGVISWSNNGGLENPEPRDIRGPQGLPGEGSPGTAAPLADAAAATVGTSTDFAREDHRHPLRKKHFTGTISAFPFTTSDNWILGDRDGLEDRVVNVVFGTPSAIVSDVAWTTTAGLARFTGTLNSGATTTIDFDIITVISASN